MYSRFLEKSINQRLRLFPVLLLVGPRQCGKTTLVQKVGEKHGMAYASFDDLNNLVSVGLDPINYLKTLQKPAILDEVQRAVEVFLPIKVDVDTFKQTGRYILTGSANPLLAPKLSDSLVGRMAICNLWPLSQGEIIGQEESFLDALFSNEYAPFQYKSHTEKELVEKLVTGGFPKMQTITDVNERKFWCNEYLSLILQKDISDLAKIDNFIHIPTLVYSLGARVGSTINIEELSRLAKTPSTSIRRYIQLLENLFLLYKVPAWHPTVDKRLAKAPKIYFSDSALLLHVLNINKEQLEVNRNTFGHVLENFVIMECVKQISWSNLMPKLYHFRNERNAEVDIVLEANDKIVGIEIKSSSVVRSDDIKGLAQLKNVAGDKFHRGILLYMGEKIVSLGEKIHAVPLSALWY